MGKRKHPRPRRPKFTPLKSQGKEGSKLRGPLAKLAPKFEVIDWTRDLLPEHLWLAALADEFGLDSVSGMYNAFMDAVDANWPHDFVALGLISDFGRVPNTERASFIEKNRLLIDKYFHGPIGRIMSLYPDGPATWLVSPKLLEAGGPVDPFVELGHLRKLVMMLAPGKDKFAGRIRAIPLNRLFKHNKLYLFKGLEVANLLPKYPVGLTEGEQYHVESFARSTLDMTIQHREVSDALAWPKYFWRHNYDLLPCRPTERQVVGGEVVSAGEGEKITDRLGKTLTRPCSIWSSSKPSCGSTFMTPVATRYCLDYSQDSRVFTS